MFRHSLHDSEEEILSGSNKNSPAHAPIPRFHTPGSNKNLPTQALIPRFFTPFRADISQVDASRGEADEGEEVFSSCPDIGRHFSPSILT